MAFTYESGSEEITYGVIINMIDVNFDFTSDTPGYWDGYWERNNGLGGCGKYDPDSYSPALIDYSRRIWSRKLPNGEYFELEVPHHSRYFTWQYMDN